MSNVNYIAPPTCAKFMKSDAFFRGIMGPVGSGKTTACLFELLRRACEQAPAPDGFRYTRFAIIRQTLVQLKATVLKDIMAWFRPIATYKVQENTVYIEFGDVKSEWILIPMENQEDQNRLLSSQLSGAWFSEIIEIDIDLVAPVSGRCSRYPSGQTGVCTWAGMIADTNFPSVGSDWHKAMEVDVPMDWQWFKQPGGLEANAENLPWLTQTEETIKLPEDDPARIAQGRKYYERLANNKNADWVKRYVSAQYGDDPSGTAVFRDSFKINFHVVDEVIPVSSKSLLVGLDFGRDPCAIICQLDHKGRLLILEEVIAEDTGLEMQLRVGLRPALMNQRYLGKSVVIIGDPAGMAKSTLYEETSFDLVKRAGFMAYPAPTNNPETRIRAVESFLLAQSDGGPAAVIDRQRCPVLVRALSGGYRFAKTKAGMRKPTPDKNEYSHIADALQYVALAAHGGDAGMTGYILRQQRRTFKPRARMPSRGWT